MGFKFVSCLSHASSRLSPGEDGKNKGSTLTDRPFAASHSRGTKPPCWRAKVALGQDKQRKLPFTVIYAPVYVFCLSCPNATFALQRGGFVPREELAAKGLFKAQDAQDAE